MDCWFNTGETCLFIRTIWEMFKLYVSLNLIKFLCQQLISMAMMIPQYGGGLTETLNIIPMICQVKSYSEHEGHWPFRDGGDDSGNAVTSSAVNDDSRLRGPRGEGGCNNMVGKQATVATVAFRLHSTVLWCLIVHGSKKLTNWFGVISNH